MKSPTTYRPSNSGNNANAGPVRMPETPSDESPSNDAANDEAREKATVDAQPETDPPSEPQN